MPAGRPPYYETPEEMDFAIDEYWEYIDENKYPPTITGLILYLGFSDREALANYEKKPEFSDIVKRARLKVENGYEMRLSENAPTGAIFALKNMGWKDKTEQEISGSLNTGVDLSKLSDEALKQLRDAQNTNS